MKVHCPCGAWLKDDTDMWARFADLLPLESVDDYCDTVTAAIREHSAAPDVAAQYVIDRTTGFFRRCCQCASCGRLFIEDSQFQVHEFLPAAGTTSKSLLSASHSQEKISPNDRNA